MVERKNVQYALIIFVAGAVASYLFLSFEIGKRDAAIAEKQAEIEMLDRQVEMFKELSDERYSEARRFEGELNERISIELLNIEEEYPTQQGFWFYQMVAFIGEYDDRRMTRIEAERHISWIIQDNWFDAEVHLANEGLFRKNEDWFRDIYDIVSGFNRAEIDETTARERIAEVVKMGKENDNNIVKDGAWFSYMAGDKECSWTGFSGVEFPYEDYKYGQISREELEQIFNILIFDYWFDRYPNKAFKILNDEVFSKRLLAVFESYYTNELTKYQAREQVYELIQTYEGGEEKSKTRDPLYHGFWFQKLVTFIEEYNWERLEKKYAKDSIIEVISRGWLGGDAARVKELKEGNPNWFEEVFDTVLKFRAAGIGEKEAREKMHNLVNKEREEELAILGNGLWFNEMKNIIEKYKGGHMEKEEAEGRINKISLDTWFGRGSSEGFEILNSPAFFQGITNIFDEHEGGKLTEEEARIKINTLMQ